MDPASSPDWELWQQPSNPYYEEYLAYEADFLNLTGRLNVTEAPLPEPEAWELPVKWVGCVILICLSACFSGMTLGLMGLDPYGLELIIKADPEGKDAQMARKILPFRTDGNLLLCTLLLGNVAVNALLPVLLDELLGQLVSFFISTFALVILGEITPQAVCSRYALQIGSRLLWLIGIFTVLLYVIAKPIALVLDKALGEEMGTIHNKNELVEIVKFHSSQGVMDASEAKTIKGALLFSDVRVERVMTKMDRVFALREDDELTFEKISAIFHKGHSRVPVFARDDPDVVVGILLTKDLILVDPDDKMRVSEILNFFKRPVVNVTPVDTLGDVMALFKTGRAHLGIVTNNVTDIVKRRRDSEDSDLDSSSGSSSDSDTSTTSDDENNDGGGGGGGDLTSPKSAAGQDESTADTKSAPEDGSGMGRKKKSKKRLSIAEKTVRALKAKKRKKRRKLEEQRRKQMQREARLRRRTSKGRKEDEAAEAAERNDGAESGETSPKAAASNLHQIIPVSPRSPVAEDGGGAATPGEDGHEEDDETAGMSPDIVLAMQDPHTRILGVITLEDIIEEILGDEIVDETDQFVEMEKADTSIKRERSQRVAGRISLLDSVQKDTLEEREVELIAQTLVERIIQLLGPRADSMFEVRPEGLARTLHPAAMAVVRTSQLRSLSQGHIVARRHQPQTSAFMVLEGLLDCHTGSGSFKSVAGRFQMVGAGVLEDCLVVQSRQVQALRARSGGGGCGSAGSGGDALHTARAPPTTLALARSSSATAAPGPAPGAPAPAAAAAAATLALSRSTTYPNPPLSRRGRKRSDAGAADPTEYVADFTAKVSSKQCRVLEVTRDNFAEAFRATMLLETSPRAARGRGRTRSQEGLTGANQ